MDNETKETYYKKNKEAILKARKQYYYNNRERILENNRKLKKKRMEELNLMYIEFQKSNFSIKEYPEGVSPFDLKNK